MNNIRRFFELPISDKLLLLQVSVLLPFCQCGVNLLPFRYLIKIFKLKICESTTVTHSKPYLHDLDRITWTIQCVEHHVPIIAGRCFAQALTARHLLHRRNIPTLLCLGAQNDCEGLSAHAWLCCGDVVVTGGRNMIQFSKLISFL